MNMFLTIFIVICFIIIVVFGIYLILTFFSRDDIELLKGARCFNLMSKCCNNYAEGYEINVQKGRGGRWVIDYLPTDIDPDLIGEVKTERVIVDRDKRVVLPVGDLSGEKTEVIYLPPKLSDLPIQLQKSLFGKAIMEKMSEIKNDVEEKELLEKQNITQRKILDKTVGMELIEEYIETDAELNKDRMKKILADKDDKKSFSEQYGK